MTKTEKKTFNIIRHRGKQNKAQLPDGTWVERLEKVLIPEYGGFLPVADYSEHFIYEQHRYKGAIYRCTCGSPAVITGVSGYVHDASPQGKMMLCLYHATNGVHQSGGTRWI